MLQSQQEVKIVRIIRKHDQTLAPLCSLLDLTGFCLTLIMLIKLSLGKNSLKLIKFSSKDKSKKLKCRLLQFWFGALRVKSHLDASSSYPASEHFMYICNI